MMLFRAGLALAALAAAGCAPDLDALTPDTGPERTLVSVDGDTFLSTLLWDAGTGSETDLPGGFLGASVFSVPTGAARGAHPGALRRSGDTSGTLPFTVTAPVAIGGPRVDRVSLAYADFAGGTVTAWLYVQAANGDVGADVLIDGAAEPTVAHQGLTNDLLGVSPDDLDYPIRHWLAYVVPLEGTPGDTISVAVRNPGGATSDAVDYTLATDAASLDSDGDDLPDVWETGGYDADGDGTVDIDLPALGADPHRPDVFVEVDVMQGLTNPPGAAIWTGVEDVFAAAPVINPSADSGISMVLDTGGTVPFTNAIDFNLADNPMLGQADFYTLKAANFDNAVRDRVYHYAIWANARPNGSSGVSDVSFATGNGGDDLIVSFDDFPASFQTDKAMIETFVHEFGHNLGLRHGGEDHSTNNPTYSSVMSYSWQLRTGRSNATRRANPVYQPFYYQTDGATEPGGALPGAFSDLTDYSTGMGRALDESCLDETVGLWGGNAIDWNNDGDTTDTCASNSGLVGGAIARDFGNWRAITYVGPRTDGRFGG